VKSIFAKLMTLQLLCAVLATAILWTLSERSFKDSMSSGFVANGQTVAESIANSVERHLANRDLTSVQSALDASLKIPDVEWAYVTAPDGQVLADTFVPDFPQALPRSDTGKSWLAIRMPGTNKPVAIFTHPALAGIAGSVHVGFSQEGLLASMARMKVLLLTTVAVVIFLLTAIVGLVTRRVIAPVRALTRASSALADDLTGEFQALPVSSADEIGMLTASFNRMTLERQGYRKNLEARVLERTEALRENQRDMRMILNNLEQGLVTVNMDGQMSSEASRAVAVWFGAPAGGQNFAAWIGQRDANFGDWFGLGLETMQEGLLPAEMALSQLPGRLQDGGKTYSVHYQLITNENNEPGEISSGECTAAPRVPVADGKARPEKILVIITDITTILSKDAAERHQSELLQLFLHLTHDKPGVLEFLAEADEIMKALRNGQYDSFVHRKRLVHTLKGNAAIFEMVSVSTACHELENAMAEEGEQGLEPAMAALNHAWNRIRPEIQHLIGETSQTSIEIEPDDYECIHRALRDRIDASVVTRMLESCRLEPTGRRLARIEQQIMALAERTGKSNVSVALEPNDLRADRSRFAPFWSEFIHVLRNAVDHGIEDRDVRLKAGKPERPLIRVATAIDGDRFVVTIEDDGPGVDWERLLDKAEKSGLASGEDGAALKREFIPGVSSKETVTEVSGRGIGMAAVADACRALGGTMDVKSQWGAGVRIDFRFPKDDAVYEGHNVTLQSAMIPATK